MISSKNFTVWEVTELPEDTLPIGETLKPKLVYEHHTFPTHWALGQMLSETPSGVHLAIFDPQGALRKFI